MHIFNTRLIAPLLAMASLATTMPVHAAQSLDTCTGYIDSIPATISTQGNWCLRKDLATAMTSGNAITIAANNVTLDCNNFKLGGLAGGAGTTANGIYAYDQLNTTVRHCHVRGFLFGVLLDGSAGGGHVVEDNRLDSNTYAGMRVDGDGSVVRRNQVNDTGGSTVYPGNAIGILTLDAVDVLDNTVSGVLPLGSGGNADAVGIYTFNNPNGSINGNRVRGLVPAAGAGPGAGSAIGIDNSGSGRVSVRGNDLSGDGVSPGYGVYCTDTNGSAKDNIVNGFATGISGCTDDMTNVIKP